MKGDYIIEKGLLEKVCEELKRRGYETSIRFVHKNNEDIKGLNIVLCGVTATPIVYEEIIKDLGERRNLSIEQIADIVLEYSEKHLMNNEFSIDLLHDKDYILKNVRLAVCNEEWNKEWLDEIPWMKVIGTDLVAYPYVSFDRFTTKITKSLIDYHEISYMDILYTAKENGRNTYVARRLSDVVRNSILVDFETVMDAVILTNNESFYGASMILYPELLDLAMDMIGRKSAYIIPSSIHEILVISSDCMRSNEVTKMVREVNETVVLVRDRLSNSVYIYDKNGLKIIEN